MRNEDELAFYWNSIPIDKLKAKSYSDLCFEWKCSSRKVRMILHELSCYDNGDRYILIRSGRNKGFYKTSDNSEIAAYREECLNKGKSMFAPVKKCNRILAIDDEQLMLDLGFYHE